MLAKQLAAKGNSDRAECLACGRWKVICSRRRGFRAGPGSGTPSLLPGEYTGYAAVVIPGVNEAIDARDPARAQAQMANVTAALVRATETLEEVQ